MSLSRVVTAAPSCRLRPAALLAFLSGLRFRGRIRSRSSSFRVHLPASPWRVEVTSLGSEGLARLSSSAPAERLLRLVRVPSPFPCFFRRAALALRSWDWPEQARLLGLDSSFWRSVEAFVDGSEVVFGGLWFRTWSHLWLHAVFRESWTSVPPAMQDVVAVLLLGLGGLLAGFLLLGRLLFGGLSTQSALQPCAWSIATGRSASTVAGRREKCSTGVILGAENTWVCRLCNVRPFHGRN